MFLFFSFVLFFLLACIKVPVDEPRTTNTLEKCMDRLEKSLQDRADDKNKCPEKESKPAKKPKSTKGKKGKPTSKPKSAAKKVSSGKNAKEKASTKKEPTKSKTVGKLNAVIPDSLKRKFRDGCSKCRHRRGCTPSCWAARGYVLQR